MGLQGKLTLSCLALLSVTLGLTCWIFYAHNRQNLTEMAGEQARQLSIALALAGQDAVREDRTDVLRAAARDFVKSRNILFVAFLNASGEPLAFASRDQGGYVQRLDFIRTDARELMQVRHRSSPGFGNYVEVVAPMLGESVAGRSGSDGRGPRLGTGSEGTPAPGGVQHGLRGYVAVGIAQDGAEAELMRTMVLVVGIGCLMMLMSLPLAYWGVHRLFQPIRQLVRVTKKITAGDLDARVAISRTDEIGELARSFNEMVLWVKNQQQDVAAANQKLHEANRDLEAKVATRTAQVETAIQRLSSEIAEKEDFLRAVSHDLNAPLRNISGMATMLLMKYKDQFEEDVLHRLERIKKNVDVETDLIAELLELSRIKTRRQKMEPVNVEAMIWELRGLFENDLKSRAIELVVDTSLPILEAERARIRRIFQNLVDNAIKYMGDGVRREIHIGCTIGVTEAEFYVRDTGIGIDPEDIDKVFFVFRRGKNSMIQSIPGKGVGLSSVKSIVETYNGSISVESTPGEGTTFRFTINGRHVPATSEYAMQCRPPKQMRLPPDDVGPVMPSMPSTTQAEPVLG
jgi:signal transduction histidine kinase